ncbi:hypothetical protein [Shewanella algae]|uniref:hypothetical protein n=1 Tax=Shewanella algae TaxID=38313 RepID=UPI0031F54F49
MKVEKLNWTSKSAQEAELTITDGEYSCIAFCQPCEYEKGAEVDYLHAFMAKEVMLSNSGLVSIEALEEKVLPHRVTAVVEDRLENIVKVGSIIIELDCAIPAGVDKGMLVDFECSRLDVW